MHNFLIRQLSPVSLLFLLLTSTLSFSQDYSLKDTSIINSYILKADTFFQKADYTNSTKFYEKAATMQESVLCRSKDPMILSKYLTIRRYIAYNYASAGEFRKAKNYLEVTLRMAGNREEPNDNVMADICRSLGNINYSIGNIDTASVYLSRSIEIYLKQKTCNELNLASAYNDYGNVLEAKAQYAEALKYKYNSLHIKEKLSQDDKIVITEGLCSIANTYQKIGKYDTAQIIYLKAFHELQKEYGENHPEIGNVLNNLGTIYFQKGDFEIALKYYEKALSVFKRFYPQNHPLIAYMYNNIGSEMTSTGEYEMAILYFKQSEKIYIDNFGPGYLQLADIYNNLGTVYNYLSQYELAVEYYLKSIEIRSDNLGNNNLDIAYTYDNIGTAYLLRGTNMLALDYYIKAFALRQSYLHEMHKDLASSYNNIGCIYQIIGQNDSSFIYYKKALYQYLKTAGYKHPDLANCYNNIGFLFKEQSRWKTALYYYQKAIIANSKYFNDSINILSNPLIINYYSGKEMLTSLVSKAIILSKLYYETHSNEYSGKALSTFLLCDSLIDNIRLSFLSNSDRIALGKTSDNIYREAIELCYELWKNETLSVSYFEKALYFSERNKNAALLLTIEEANIKKMADIPDSLLKIEKSIALKKTYYETRIKEISLVKENTDELNEIENKYFRLIQEEERLRTFFKTEYPKYYEFKYHSRLLTLKDLGSVLDSSITFIEYFLGNNDLYTFVITSKTFHIEKESIDTTIINTIKHFSESIYNDDFEFFAQNSFSLYNLFIKPVSYLLDSCIKKIFIIPDENFYDLPFEALIDKEVLTDNINFGKLGYLIRNYQISYYYSLFLYFNSLEQADYKENKESNFVGFSPAFNSSSMINGMSFANLKFAIDEVLVIDQLFKKAGNQTKLFLNDAASESNFKNSIDHFKYVHIATHGYSNNEEPSLSFLAFVPSKEAMNNNGTIDSAEEDGILHTSEMYDLSLSADLVVLSACETGVGKMVEGEGAMTMTRGFIYSGANNIVQTLWNVDDETTKELMKNFYGNILNNKCYSYSLREAKLKLIDSETMAFPHFWAGYILIGK